MYQIISIFLNTYRKYLVGVLGSSNRKYFFIWEIYFYFKLNQKFYNGIFEYQKSR